jgi:S-formylglutathione hydrolase FrmB
MRAVWRWFVGLPLLHGPVPAVLTAGLIAGLLVLITARSNRRWFTRSVPLALALCAVLLAGAWVAVRRLKPFPDAPPWTVLAWVGATFLGVTLVVVAWRHQRWRRRGVLVIAGGLVVLGAAGHLNQVYGPFPTVSAALQLAPHDQVPAASVLRFRPIPTRQPGGTPGHPLPTTWTPPPDVPVAGELTQVTIPATASGFAARSAWLYAPPAYLTADRPLLPVLVLIGGQPGSPRDWVDAGAIAQHMDAFAAAHHGLAPVVVMPDALGGEANNPMCMDSRLGKADSYLATDVPAWIDHSLQVNTDTSHWAVGGFSYGGTCALQLAVAHPDLFPTFLDISGQQSPTLGDPATTVSQAFGGDEAAFAAVDPLHELATRELAHTAAWLTVGSGDAAYKGQEETVRSALTAAGATVTGSEIPGGHSWETAVAGLVAATPWIAQRTGLIP